MWHHGSVYAATQPDAAVRVRRVRSVGWIFFRKQRVYNPATV